LLRNLECQVHESRLTEEPPNKEETPQDKAETEPETQTADSVEAPATDTTEEEGGTQ